MNFKNAAVAVALSAGIGLALQDFGLPPGVPNVFSSGEVAVAEDVNENFGWVEDELAQLEITDSSHALLIDAIATATKQRSQSFAASGYFQYGGACGPGLLQGKSDELGGGLGFLGWMDLPAPSDWDTLTDMTVTFTLINYVGEAGQSAQDINIDIYGNLIGSGDIAFEDDPILFPGPDSTYDFYAEAFVSVPTVQPYSPLAEAGGGGGYPGDSPYLVSASFTISSELLSGEPNPFSDPKHIRVNFFEPSGPIFVGKIGGGGGIGPCLFFASGQDLNPYRLDLFVTVEYSAL